MSEPAWQRSSGSGRPSASGGGGVPPRLERPLELLLWGLVVALAAAALVWLAPLLRRGLQVLTPFVAALLLAYVLDPIVSFVQRTLRLGRLAGMAALAAALLVVAAAVVLWLAPVLYRQAVQLIETLRQSTPAILERLLAERGQGELAGRLGAWAQEWLQRIEGVIKSGGEALGGAAPAADLSLGMARGVVQGVRTVAAAVGSVIGWALGVALTVIIAFYYLLDMDRIPRVIRRLIPPAHRERAWAVLLKIDDAVGGFLRGQLTACVGVGVLSVLLLLWAGLREFAVLIGVAAGVFNLIPYLGPVIGAAPALLWVAFTPQLADWSDRGLKAALLLGGFALIQAIDGLVFQPLIVGRQARLHPVAVMLALAIGAQAGLGGMLLAVPALCVVKVLWFEFVWSRTADGAPLPSRPAERPLTQVSAIPDDKT